MKNLIFIGLVFVLLSCQNNGKQNKQAEGAIVSSHTGQLPTLTEGEFSLSERDFGDIVELKGISHPVDHFFKVWECEMIASDSILIVRNFSNTELFMAFTLPDFTFIKSFGVSGKGPGEFQYPHLIKDESGEYLCFIYESARAGHSLFALDRNLEITMLPFNFSNEKISFSDKQLYGISSEEFYYVESFQNGKAMFHLESISDTSKITFIKDLSFSGQHQNWAACIGDFGVSGKNNRLVFAYKYFKQLLFYDTENNTSKLISFHSPSETKAGDAVSMLEPTNVTHYWGMSTNNQYVYVLYSGRTPVEVSSELKRSSGFIYIEQFDWNGNPVHKFKLDHWGYFCVDALDNTIYLASITDEQPFYSYKLP